MAQKILDGVQKVVVVDRAFDEILEQATQSVRPPEFMIKFYNFMARIPLRIGVLIFLLTAIDTVQVALNAMRNRTDAALQVIYQYKVRPWRLFWGLGDHVWQSSYNCRSVRARGIFTREAIEYLLEKVVGSSLTIASLGSGSASQILQGVSDNNSRGNEIRLILVDNDLRALEVGRRNAQDLGIEDLVDSREVTVGKFLKSQPADSLDLVEMVGLADYFDDDRFSSYLHDIYRSLKKNGCFLGANITSEEEAPFAHKIACWPRMHYREKEEIKNQLEEAGFKNFWTGNCGLYTVWVAQKEESPPHHYKKSPIHSICCNTCIMYGVCFF